MDTFISHSPAETEAIGERWGRDAQRGAVYALSGDLGAGKTQLVRGIARGLGIHAHVHSPSFAIVNMYEGGRLPLYHLDLYRLETPEALRSAGVEEYLQPSGVAVIEWAERLFQSGDTREGMALDPGFRKVRSVVIEFVDETSRRILCDEDPRA